MKQFIGTKKFYKMLFAIVLPIVLQQFITQFVSLLDNLMVGQIGESEMAGVSLGNQLLFIFNLAIFGSLGGASIFATQFIGANSKKGYHETIRFKWLVVTIILVLSTLIFLLFNDSLLNAFITSNEGDTTNPEIVLSSGKTYLVIMLIGNLPFIIKEVYSSSLREMKETFFPMISGIVAILVNLIINYLLIFGKFGFPKLGVTGAAIGTVVSRFVEMLLVVLYTHIKKEKFSFFTGVYKRIFVKVESVKKFLPRTLLLLTNEVLWSLGLTLILKSYSVRGLDIVASFNICNTITNVFTTIGISFGNATAIIIGNMLGANEINKAKESSLVILGFSVVATLLFTGIMIGTAHFVPNIYNASDYIKDIASDLIIIGAFSLPFQAWNCVCYFILRAGGKVVLTMFFDCLFIILVRFPITFALAELTNLDIRIIYIIGYSLEVLKSFAGFVLVKKGIWLKTIV